MSYRPQQYLVVKLPVTPYFDRVCFAATPQESFNFAPAWPGFEQPEDWRPKRPMAGDGIEGMEQSEGDLFEFDKVARSYEVRTCKITAAIF